MKLSKRIVSLGAGLCVLGVAALVIAGVPDDKKEIKIDRIPGKKGVVVFPHAKHAGAKGPGGVVITCKACHHREKEDNPAPETIRGKHCASCHVKPGEQKKKDGDDEAPELWTGSGMKNLFHTTCRDCHKKMKAEGKNISACSTCHK